MERFIGYMFVRFRDRPSALAAFGIGWVALIAIAVTVLGTVIPAFLLFDATVAEWARITVVGCATALAGIFAAVFMSRGALMPTWRWLRAGNQRPDPEAAWRSAAETPARVTTLGIVIVSIGHLLITAPFATIEFDQPAWGYVGIAVLILIAVVFAWVLLVFVVEFALRPLVAEIATELAPEAERPLSAWRLPIRTLLPIPAVAMLSGVITAAVALEFTESAAAGTLAIGATALLMGALITPLMKAAVSDPLMEPISDLTAGTERVAKGDLGSALPIRSSDELGALAAGFNRMQVGLRERESLRRENTELLDEVRASRARIVAASDAERRRVERNLHDGAQQQLVALALQLSMLEDRAESAEQRATAAKAKEDLNLALTELRELARGLHPQVLSTGGLAPALAQLAERSPIPVSVEASRERFPDPVESTAYFVASEALANIAKYAEASRAEITAERRNGRLMVSITDDGVGGADAGSGSGISGLADRVAALDGELRVHSPQGGGTTVRAELPLDSGS